MILDNEQQRAFLLDLFNAVQIPGQHLTVAYEIRMAIEKANLLPPALAGDSAAG